MPLLVGTTRTSARRKEGGGCIFCRDASPASSTEHLIPQSLGGDESARLPPGLVCDRCNQYFGSKVESRVLTSYPFSLVRVMWHVPSKKGRYPTIPGYPGSVTAGPRLDELLIEVKEPELFEEVRTGKLRVLLVSAEVREPEAITRFLLKVGLESLALVDPVLARGSRFDRVRAVARSPRRGSSWWFAMTSPHNLLDELAADLSVVRPLAAAWAPEVQGKYLGCLSLAGFLFLTPLESGVRLPHSDDPADPEVNLFSVRF